MTSMIYEHDDGWIVWTWFGQRVSVGQKPFDSNMSALALSPSSPRRPPQRAGVEEGGECAGDREAVAEVESQEAPEPEAAKPAARRGGSRTK